MALGAFVDWRGRGINTEVHGGVRATWFLHALNVVTNVVIVPNLLNLVTYLHGTMHMGVSGSATVATNFIGATSGFALIGAFRSDSYITRSRTMLLFGPFMFLGYGLLALQAHLPSLHPPPCDIKAELNNCKEVHGWNATLLYIALYMSAFGDGTMRVCLPSLGADQFDHDPAESRQQSSFFNWYIFRISFGGFIGLVLIVWLENYKGFDIGFGVCTILILLGLLVVAAGIPFYRNQMPEGIPLTRILQVLVVAFRNRQLELPKQSKAVVGQGQIPRQSLHQPWQQRSLVSLQRDEGRRDQDRAPHAPSLRQLHHRVHAGHHPLHVHRAAGRHDGHEAGPDPRLPRDALHHPTAFQMAMFAVYDRFLVPFLRRHTGLAGGVTHLQRVGVGFAAVTLASVIAAVVERKRKEDVEKMSLFWLAPQFPRLLEFFNSEAPRGMKSIATALFWCDLGLASLMATLLVQVVNVATRRGGRGGWLEGASLDDGRLDLFYWVVAVVGLLGFFNYLYWAKKYAYQHNPRVFQQSVYHDSA